jgi:F-type H+-transporting ATPase subunit delta
MTGTATIARPYAQAAFELASEAGNLPAWSNALAALTAAVGDPQLKAVARDPRVAAERLEKIVLAVAGAESLAAFGNFVRILIQAKRLLVAPEIARQFEERRAQMEGIADVEVISAFELEPEEEQRIVSAMKRRFGKEVRLTRRVDANLIGGAIIRIGDSVFDASLRGRLRHLASMLQR